MARPCPSSKIAVLLRAIALAANLIADSINRRWISTDPKKHVDIWSTANLTHNGYLVPLIRSIGLILSWTKEVRLYWTPRAEDERRQDLVSNSFAVAITPERTTGYYNNEQIIARWIRLEWLRMRFERVYESLCQLVKTTTNFNKDQFRVRVPEAFCDYETGKGYGGITLSTKVFEQLNPSLSKEWPEIRQTLKL